tara:strand:+ start:2266 stop:2616 length:351 start_codon:yes stop_codon:yes gene_type:complete
MKWIGQHIVDFVARFRSDVYLDNATSGTIAGGGNLGLDATGKIVKGKVPLGGDDTFIHNQGSASTTWTVTHNLNKYPSVTIVTSTNVVIIGNVVYNSADQLTITIANADSGKAYLN